MSDFGTSFRRLEVKAYTAIRDPASTAVLDVDMVEWDLDRLAGHTHCLLVTYKRDGTSVPTPVWFAVREGRVLLHCARSDGKLKRIRNNSTVALAPCTFRGRPLGPAMQATAHILEPDRGPAAEQHLRRAFTPLQRLFLRLRGPMDLRHIEISG